MTAPPRTRVTERLITRARVELAANGRTVRYRALCLLVGCLRPRGPLA